MPWLQCRARNRGCDSGCRCLGRNTPPAGDLFQLDVFPDVQLGPIEERVNPNMGARRKRRLILIPEFGRLVAKIPFSVLVPQRKVPLFRSGPFFVGADAQDDGGPTVRRYGLLECLDLQRGATGHTAAVRPHAGGQRLGVLAHHEIQPPLTAKPVPRVDQLGHFVARIDMHQRKGHMAEESLAGKP